ncbi:unnamed protein product [Penicillium pancosmium]
MDRASDSEIPLKSNDDVTSKPSSSSHKTSLPGSNQNKKKPRPLLYVDSTIAGEPKALYDLICEQARLPPRVYISITGRKGFPTDFRFFVDLNSMVLQLDPNNGEWNNPINVVQDGDGVEAFRGGRYTSLEWEHSSRLGGLRTNRDLENGDREVEFQSLLGVNENSSDEGDSSLMAWCERFCRDPARIKTFTVERDLLGFDQQAVRSEISWYLKSIDYDGNISVEVHILNKSFKVYSPHCQCFVKPLLRLFAYLEVRYGVVRSVWRSSRQVKDSEAPYGVRTIYAHGRSETQIADLWSAAIAQAVKDRENSGRILGVEYLKNLQDREQERMAHVGPFLPEQNAAGSLTAGETQSGSSIPPREGEENANTGGS